MSAELVGTLLRELEYTLATAESLTGGSVGAAITSVPGASDYYSGGVIAYSPYIKTKLLGVGRDTLAEHGVVSTRTATEMAAGVKELFEVSVGVATTGVAGPDALDGLPPGTLCVAVADPFGTEAVQLTGPAGDRPAVTSWATERALVLLIRRLQAARVAR